MTKAEYSKMMEDRQKYFYGGMREPDFLKGIVALRGENSTIWIHDGQKERPVIDANSGCWGPVAIGYSNPYYLNALSKQAKKLVHTVFVSDIATEFSREIASITPKGFDKSFLVTCPSHANEAAMRLCWEVTGKWGMIAVRQAYHGMTLNVKNTTSRDRPHRKINYPSSPYYTALMPNCYCYRCPFGLEYPSCGYRCAYALEDIIKYSPHPIAALIMEPIQQANFSFPPSKEYFQIIGKICKAHGIYLIVDEAHYGGVGRLGTWFASQLYDIPADIICTGKGIGNGLPIGVTILNEEIFKKGKDKSTIYTTHVYDPLLAAAGIAVIRYIKKNNLLLRAEKLGKHMIEEITKIQKESKIIGRVAGRGLYIGLEFVKDKETKEPFSEGLKKFHSFAFQKGVFFPPERETNLLGIRPPLTIENKDVDKIINVISDGIKEVERGMEP